MTYYTPDQWRGVALGKEGRNALRAAVAAHPGWSGHRAAYGLSDTGQLHTDELINVALTLAIDIAAVTGRTPADAPATPAATPAPLAQEPAPMNAHSPIAAPVAGDAAAQLAGLIAQLAGQAMNPAAVRDLVQAEIKAALENGPVLRIECKGFDGEVRALEGKHHPKFATLLTAAASREVDGYHPNIWLTGGTASGKTHSAKAVAKALGVPFRYNGALSGAFELVGFIDAGGTYHRTAFREAYENGGVYLFDEVDGSDNAALLALNGALANGICQFPDAMVERHPDCIIIGTANTWGLGATAEYVGRAKIDAAFLSRFPVRIFWDYDEALEQAICGNADWAKRIQKARAKAHAAGLKVIIDPRQSKAGAALIAAGMSPDDAAAITYLANLTADQRRLIEG